MIPFSLNVLLLVDSSHAQSALACSPVPIEKIETIPKCAIRDRNGRILVRKQVIPMLSFSSDGLAAIRIDGILMHVNRKGRTAPALLVDNSTDYVVEGLTRIVKSGKIGFVNADLREVVAPEWDFAWPFEGGVAVVCRGCHPVKLDVDDEHSIMEDGVWGYIDRSGRVVLPVTFTKLTLPLPEEARRQARGR